MKREELIIASIPSELTRIEELALHIADTAKLTQEQSDNMAIVLTELVNNAIIHGNKNDPSKTVTISTTFTDEFVRVSIRDEGKSFNPDKIANPTDPENLWKESGRGIFLVRNLIDQVDFNPTDKGMEIIITEFLKKN